jgi:NADPH2:quinone reductase
VASDEAGARDAGCHEVVVGGSEFAQRLKDVARGGVDHIVEVAFAANIELDAQLLKMHGSIATYATDHKEPAIPFWPLVFQNARIFFLGSDDFPLEAKIAASHDLNAVLQAGWSGFEIAERVPLAEIAHAHELLEHPQRRGRVVVMP